MFRKIFLYVLATIGLVTVITHSMDQIFDSTKTAVSSVRATTGEVVDKVASKVRGE